MTEEPAGISSDLQWMIESGQANQEMLAETLVNDHYLPIYRLALAMLGDARGAHQAAMQTISGAMVDLPKQRRSVHVTTWLYGHAIKTINRQEPSTSTDSPAETVQTEAEAERSSEIRKIFQSYGLKERYALALYYLLEWQVEDIASVLRVSEQAVEIQFDISRAQFRPLFDKSHDGAAPPPSGLSQAQIRAQRQEQLDVQIRQSFPLLSFQSFPFHNLTNEPDSP